MFTFSRMKRNQFKVHRTHRNQNHCSWLTFAAKVSSLLLSCSSTKTTLNGSETNYEIWVSTKLYFQTTNFRLNSLRLLVILVTASVIGISKVSNHFNAFYDKHLIFKTKYIWILQACAVILIHKKTIVRVAIASYKLKLRCIYYSLARNSTQSLKNFIVNGNISFQKL